MQNKRKEQGPAENHANQQAPLFGVGGISIRMIIENGGIGR
jgi:hypothetical protein